jgi:hypothetical protein
MAWKDISSTVTKYKDTYGSIPSGVTAVCLQYDDEETNPVEAKVRFKYYRTDSGKENFYDSMYILYNANDSESSVGNLGRTLFLLKGYTGNVSKITWPFYSEAFTIKKNYQTDHFTIQDFWICNNGYNVISATATKFYESSRYYRNGKAGSFSCWSESGEFNISGTTATPVGKGTVTITDHYNNTFSISATKGAAGDNNPSSGPTVSWGYTNSYGNSGTVSKKALSIVTPSDIVRRVYAKCVTGATYGSDAIVTALKDIRQYVAPKAPGVPKLTYKKSRLTISEPWTFSWTAATAASQSAPVKGYRIRLYKNNSIVKGLAVGEGNEVVLNKSGTNGWLDRESTSTTVILDPVEFGFEAGDTIKLGIYAYTRYGETNTGAQLFDSAATEKVSSVYAINNAGIIHVKPAGSWVEGQVYVKVNGAWKEAETVYTKVSGAWKESV